MKPADYWSFLALGYLYSVAIETPVLLVGLSRRHGWADRLLAGVWLTACTYPIVSLVLPLLMLPACPRWAYLAVGETFAPLAECTLFWLAFGCRAELWKRSMWRDMAAVVAANLASFTIGEFTPLGHYLARLSGQR